MTEVYSAEDYYCRPDYMIQMVRSGDVVLLKGSWLLKCCEEKRVLPRRQELPAEAIWATSDVDDMEERLDFNDLAFVSISHCWYDEDHPDAGGLQLEDLRPTLEAKLNHGRGMPFGCGGINNPVVGNPNFDLAIFFCWCSIFQHPRASDAEEAAFQRSMQHMDLWYANRRTEVWMLTKVTDNVVKMMPYNDRGWTTWEKIVSLLMPPQSHRVGGLLDLGLLPKDVPEVPEGADTLTHSWRYMWIRKHAQTRIHTPPLMPDEFDVLIDTKFFTKGKPDLYRVKENYRRNFDQIMGVITNMHYEGCETAPFGLDKVKQLSLVLRLCKQLQALVLVDCEVGDEGMAILAGSLSHCKSLERLYVDRCRLGHSGARELANLICNLPKLTCVDVRGNFFSKEDVAMLVQGCEQIEDIEYEFELDDHYEPEQNIP